MKRNNLIAIAVGTVMSAALSTAYADGQLAPAPDDQQANQQAPNAPQAGTQLNPAHFGNADSDDQEPSGQADRRHGERHDDHDVTSDRRDIARDGQTSVATGRTSGGIARTGARMNAICTMTTPNSARA